MTLSYRTPGLTLGSDGLMFFYNGHYVDGGAFVNRTDAGIILTVFSGSGRDAIKYQSPKVYDDLDAATEAACRGMSWLLERGRVGVRSPTRPAWDHATVWNPSTKKKGAPSGD